MKNKLGLFVFFIAIVFTSTGCATPPPPPPVVVLVSDIRLPLTISLIERLVGGSEFMADDIRRFQLYIFGRISLVRESLESRPVNVNEGRALIENMHRRDELILDHQTPGLVLNVEHIGGRVRLHVAFESGESALLFTAKRDDPDGFFSLEYNPNNNTVSYGGSTYRISYTGDRPPLLLIGVDQTDTIQPAGRRMGGRRLPESQPFR